MDKFQVGDIVEAFGVRGEIISLENSPSYPILVKFYDTGTFWNKAAFIIDGKFEDWHKEPSLKLIERPKKKVKRTYWFATALVEWDNVFKRGISELTLDKEELNDSYRGVNCKDRQIHSIEIEEEE